MKISGFQKLTLLDFPEKVACIIFTQGCNFKCSYCQNSVLISQKCYEPIPEDEIFEYLKKRKKVLDGVVISGGEPTIQKDLYDFIEKIKKMGFSIKLDTNGNNPIILKKLLDNNLLDYVAMDIKNIFSEYKEVAKINVNIDNIKESIKLLCNSNIPHEFRTTIIKNIHSIQNILEICSYFDKKEKIYIQNFEQSENVIDKKLVSFSHEELIELNNKIKERFPNVIFRNL